MDYPSTSRFEWLGARVTMPMTIRPMTQFSSLFIELLNYLL